MQTDNNYFEADDKSLEDVLFLSQRRFRIPRYQRPYTWEDEQISQFWEDLALSEEPFFLGSFIFNVEQEKTEGFVDIIDGQQRLITVTVFSAVLRDIAKELDSEIASFFHRNDIVFEDRRTKRQITRIQPADTLAGFFKNQIENFDGCILNSQPETQEEERIKKAYEFFREKVLCEIKRFPKREAQLEQLNKFRTKLCELLVINVEIKREEDAYEIFEATNARGMELSVADLLKNLIFKKLPPGENKDFAKEVWQDIVNNVESSDLRKFIRYFWMSKYAFVSEKRLYRKIKDEITDWQGLVENLYSDSTWFKALVEGDEAAFQDLKHGYKIYEAVFALRLMGVSQCYVLLLSILRNFDRLGTDPTRIFQLIEKFSFQYFVICKLSPNKVEKIYSKNAIKLEKICNESAKNKIAGEIQSLFSHLENELREIAPSRSLFLEKFNSLSYKNSEDGRCLVKYVLSKLNRHFDKTGEQKVDFNTVDVEHILPQKPHKDWKLTKKEIKPYVNKLGNLTLLWKPINGKAQNFVISKKIAEFEKSKLPITERLVEFLKTNGEKWGEAEIDQRQKDLSEISFKSIWAI